jgi:hypothetical protein
VTGPVLARGTPCLIEADVPIAFMKGPGFLDIKVARQFLVRRGLSSEPDEHKDRAEQAEREANHPVPGTGFYRADAVRPFSEIRRRADFLSSPANASLPAIIGVSEWVLSRRSKDRERPRELSSELRARHQSVNHNRDIAPLCLRRFCATTSFCRFHERNSRQIGNSEKHLENDAFPRA